MSTIEAIVEDLRYLPKDRFAAAAEVIHKQKQGQRIPTNDIWIAATAIEYDLPLLSTDIHFKRIDSLSLILFAV